VVPVLSFMSASIISIISLIFSQFINFYWVAMLELKDFKKKKKVPAFCDCVVMFSNGENTSLLDLFSYNLKKYF
jgi:hypothetical protein